MDSYNIDPPILAHILHISIYMLGRCRVYVRLVIERERTRRNRNTCEMDEGKALGQVARSPPPRLRQTESLLRLRGFINEHY